MDQAIDKYQEKAQFNIPVTKMCTIRGKSNIIGRMRNDCMWTLETGDLITLTSDERYETCSTNEVCYISNFENIIKLLSICDLIKIGTKVELHVVKIVGSFVTCCVYKSGMLKSFKKLFCPQINFSQHVAVNQEIRDCNFAINHKFDFIIVPNVQKAEYFHAIKKITKRTDVKLIGRIEEAVDNAMIERIYEHFYGLYVDCKEIDLNFLSALRSKLGKPILSKYPTDGSRYGIQICEVCDSLELRVTCIPTLIKAQIRLKKITADIDKYAEYNKKSGDNKKYAYNYSNYASNEAVKFLIKPVICITKRGDTLKNIKNRYIIALTKDDKIAKRIQLRKNVVPMLYIDCDEKSFKEQVTEMTRIGMKYLLDHNIIVNEKSVAVQYDDGEIN
ncbi:unnamed protein product [Chironomus riparius]|uniref:pyruvate kinase n=1 Tax=Chironomus riparius TaxID=315576 RepID=A0A9N9S023_9DIPT|nr:unnamed protein product [Chironomus riparius]